MSNAAAKPFDYRGHRTHGFSGDELPLGLQPIRISDLKIGDPGVEDMHRLC